MINKKDIAIIIFLSLLQLFCSKENVQDKRGTTNLDSKEVSDQTTSRFLTYKIYLDADQSGSKESGKSIALGIKTALYENGYKAGDKSLELKILDHRGNFNRSKYHIETFLNDSSALAMFCGLHSPPVLANRDFINNNGIPLLDPWAAAAPITRGIDSAGRNWIFRLSIDDSKAGKFLIRKIVDEEKKRKIALLLEETGWGHSNYTTITKELNKRGMKPVITKYFNWSIKEAKAHEILQDIHKAKADVIILVSNAPEAKTFVRSMLKREPEERLPIRSHWGITGGDFFEKIGDDIILNKYDLSFIQTSFSFLNNNIPNYKIKVFNNLKKLAPKIQNYKDLDAPTGFIHAYDLTNILLLALNKMEWSNDIKENRLSLRNALEEISEEYKGLIKNYKKPFAAYSKSQPDAHEALSINDLRMARYYNDGSIRIKNGDE